MERFHPLTRAVTVGVLALALLAGFSMTSLADEAKMDKMEKMDAMDTMHTMEKMDVNVATAKQLEAVPGIGEELAKRIVDYRTSNGNFATVQDLVNVKGIGKETLAKMEAHLMVGAPAKMDKSN